MLNLSYIPVDAKRGPEYGEKVHWGQSGPAYTIVLNNRDKKCVELKLNPRDSDAAAIVASWDELFYAT